jgi:hypothetical protein
LTVPCNALTVAPAGGDVRRDSLHDKGKVKWFDAT